MRCCLKRIIALHVGMLVTLINLLVSASIITHISNN